MCGFSGFFSNTALPEDTLLLLKEMGNAIYNRGPDSAGEWFCPKDKIGLSHRRLAIVDISPAGHQPMQSATERYVIAFNGEIYNHQTLRRKLEKTNPAITWRGNSDTETLLAAIENWGLFDTLAQSVGMFAIALWDKENKQLHLARDRFGEKPLYYGWSGENFIFGSELKSIRIFPGFESEIDRNSLTLLLRYGYISAPYSIYKNVCKLLPATILTFDASTQQTRTEKYWNAQQLIEQSVLNQHSDFDEKYAVDQLDVLLREAVKAQMMADVPLGAFLSGGVDSSAIVALMQAQSTVPVKTFSIGFHEKEYNEAEHAKAVALHLGTEHRELYVTAEDALAVIPKLCDIYDEPFADASQLPTFLVSQMAKQHVTVSLSGDAGDEIFCGYNRYVMTEKVWHQLSVIPVPLKLLLSKTLLSFPVERWNRLNKYLPQRWQMRNLGDKLHKAAVVLSSTSIDQLYLGLVSHWPNPADVVLRSVEPSSLLTDDNVQLQVNDPIERMMALDTLTYLPDDILVKVDRAAMAVSLETRAPFLDHRVFEYAWQLPKNVKLKQGSSKWCLRQVLYRYVPESLIERPKMGFAVPIDKWLRGPLRDWAQNLLHKERLIAEGFFDADKIDSMWKEHLTEQRNCQYQLWNVLMFQLWYEKNHR